jgi:hypothetical protein
MNERRIQKRNVKTILNYHDYLEMKTFFNFDDEIREALKNLKPNDDVTELLRLIADQYENDYDDVLKEKINKNRIIRRLLAVGRDFKINDGVSLENRRAVVNILHEVNENWLYRQLSAMDMNRIANTNYSELYLIIEEMIKKYNRKSFTNEDK